MRAWVVLSAVCCSSSAFGQTTWFPGANDHATLLFEDLWPNEGDFDFNDLVLRVNVERHTSGAALVDATWSLDVWGLGASSCSGLALRLPVAPADLVGEIASGTAGAADGSPWTVSRVPAVTDGAGGSVIVVSTDLRADLCGGASGFINTVEGAARHDCAPAALRVLLYSPTVVPTEATDPGDWMLFGCQDPGVQVHRSMFYGVPGGPFAVDPSQYGRGADASDVDASGAPTGLRFYVNANGVPFALSLGDGITGYPAERRRISDAFPEILAFAAGTGGSAWWHAPQASDAYDLASTPPLTIGDLSTSDVDECLADPDGTWDKVADACDCGASLDPLCAGNGSACWTGVECASADEVACEVNPAGQWNETTDTCVCDLNASWNGSACTLDTQTHYEDATYVVPSGITCLAVDLRGGGGGGGGDDVYGSSGTGSGNGGLGGSSCVQTSGAAILAIAQGGAGGSGRGDLCCTPDVRTDGASATPLTQVIQVVPGETLTLYVGGGGGGGFGDYIHFNGPTGGKGDHWGPTCSGEYTGGQHFPPQGGSVGYGGHGARSSMKGGHGVSSGFDGNNPGTGGTFTEYSTGTGAGGSRGSGNVAGAGGDGGRVVVRAPTPGEISASGYTCQ